MSDKTIYGDPTYCVSGEAVQPEFGLPTYAALADQNARLRAECDELHAKLAVAVGLTERLLDFPGGMYAPALEREARDTLATLPDRAKALMEVLDLTAKYRETEQEETPRMFRGRKLHELGLRIDNALARLKGEKNG